MEKTLAQLVKEYLAQPLQDTFQYSDIPDVTSTTEEKKEEEKTKKPIVYLPPSGGGGGDGIGGLNPYGGTPITGGFDGGYGADPISGDLPGGGNIVDEFGIDGNVYAGTGINNIGPSGDLPGGGNLYDEFNPPGSGPISGGGGFGFSGAGPGVNPTTGDIVGGGNIVDEFNSPGDDDGGSSNVGGTGTAAAADTSQGQTGYGSCFIAGTKVTMADGTLKNIEDIIVGDKVKGHKENNEVIKLDPTLLADRKLYSFNNDEHYFFTSEHPFMTEEGWKSIKPEKTKERDGVELYEQLKGELKVGDKLVTDNGSIEIKSIESKQINNPEMPLYNFNVSNDNSYIADGYIVHNKGGNGGNGGNGGGGTYVCTASYANNLITPLDFKTLKKYGIKLRRNDKYLMKAYDWFGPKLAAAVKKGKLVNFAKHSTSMWKYEQTKENASFKIKFISRFHKIITRPIIRVVGIFITIKNVFVK